MEWVVYAVISPLLFSVGNIIDRIILTKYFKHPKSLFYIGNLFYFIYLSLLFFTNLKDASLIFIAIGLLAGLVHFCAMYFYFQAVSKEDISNLLILFQAVSILTLVLSYFFLQEKLNNAQIIAFVLIFSASMLASFHRFRITPALPYVLFVVIFIALNNVLMKLAYGGLDTMQGFFLNGIAHSIVLVPLFLDRKGRKEIAEDMKTLKSFQKTLLAVPAFLGFFGLLFFFKALTLAPVSLVSLLGSLSALFGFIISLLLSKFFPGILNEDFSRLELIKKTIAIFITFAGFFLLTK